MRSPLVLFASALTLALATRAMSFTAVDAPAAASSAADTAAVGSPVLTSSVLPNVPWELLEGGVTGPVTLRVRVVPDGTVDSIQFTSGDPRLKAASIAAARWSLYRALKVATWVELTLPIPVAADWTALSPDPVALALEAEQVENLREAIDAWTGAIARVGRHPSLQDDVAIRTHIIELARRMPEPLAVPNMATGPVRAAQQLLARNMSRAVSSDVAASVDDALRIAPWFGKGYRLRAAALVGCGRIDDARRSVMLFRAASKDSAEQALAEKALASLAKADTISAVQMLKY